MPRFPRFKFRSLHIKPAMRFSSRQKAVSPAEFEFSKWYKQTNHRQLIQPLSGEYDWFDPMTQAYYEIKDINYPSTQFTNEIRLDRSSITNRMKEHRKDGFVVLMFTDGVKKIARIEDVSNAAHVPEHDMFGDGYPTYLVPIRVFSPLS